MTCLSMLGRLCAVLCLFYPLVASQILSGEFENPSNQYHPRFFYWFPDASVSSEILRQDIESIAAVGGGGVTVVPHYIFGLPIDGIEPPKDWARYGYGTPAFHERFRGILKTGQENEMRVDFGLGASQGQGIPAPVESRGLAVQLLAGNLTLQPGQSFDGLIPPPSELPQEVSQGEAYQHAMESFGNPNLTARIAVQIINSTIDGREPVYHVEKATIVDLSDQVEEGRLSWTAPDGESEWRLFTFWEGYTNQRSIKGGINATDFLGNGSWVVDHFSKAGAQLMTNFVDEYVINDNEIRDLVKSLKSKGFLDRFKEAKGYSLVKYLPLIFVAHNQFRQAHSTYHEEYIYGPYSAQNISLYNLDYLDVLTSCYGEYLQALTDWCHGVGMEYSAQTAYNIPVDMSASIPHVDLPQTESLAFLDVVDSYKEFTGPAHVANAKIISTELGATLVTYTQMLSSLIWQAKRSWAAGVNDIVIHGAQYSGDYVGTTWPGFQGLFLIATENWSRLQPAWQHFSDITNFFGRNNMVLQQGISKVDLAFYLHKPTFVQGQENFGMSQLLEKGYTHEYLGPSNFDLPLAEVNDNALASKGPGYKALVLHDQTGISSAAASRLLSYAESGLPIFFVGQAPRSAISAVEAEQSKVSELMDEVLGNKFGNVHQMNTLQDLLSALEDHKIEPRVKLGCPNNKMYTVWRSDADSGNEYVYIYNDDSQSVSCSFTFRSILTEPTAYILDAWTGETRLLLNTTNEETSILTTTLKLAANETMLLAFTEQGVLSPAVEVSNDVYLTKAIVEGSDIRLSAAFSQPGEVVTKDSVISHKHSVAPPTVLEEWDLTISAWHGPSPDDEDAMQVRTHVTDHHFDSTRLLRWSELNATLAQISGIGTYRTNFTCPQSLEESTDGGRAGAFLSLPPIEHTLRASINGQPLPAFDSIQPLADLTPHLRCGGDDDDNTNELVVVLSTPLLNAVKNELSTAMFIGMTLEMIDERYHDLDWMPHGLLGPVEVKWVVWKEATVASVPKTSRAKSASTELKNVRNRITLCTFLAVSMMILW